MHMYFPNAPQVMVVHRRVNVGDFVYYGLGSGPRNQDDVHVYARVEDFQDGRVAYVTGYSVAAPDGEFGSIPLDAFQTHVTPEEFEKARAAGWPHSMKVLEPTTVKRPPRSIKRGAA